MMQPANDDENRNNWYCVRSKPKNESIAAGQLRMFSDVEVFCPRMRYQKATVRGPVWFTEAIFPGYLFARFDLAESLPKVANAFGVRGMVRFGERCASLPARVIADLRENMDGKEMKLFSAPVNVGDSARVLQGPFRGIEVVVQRFLPARERVKALIDIMGRTTQVEVELSSLAAKPNNPLAA